MRKLRFTIASLLLLVLVAGVGVAALRESNEIWDSVLFTVTIGVLLIALLLAMHCPGRRRAFWVGFAVFGAVYLGLSIVPSIESRLVTTKCLAFVASNVPRLNPTGRGSFDFLYTGSWDLAFTDPSQPTSVFLNNGNGRFEDVTATAGLSVVGNQGAGNTSFLMSALGASTGTTVNFMRIGHSLVALVAAFAGGQVSRHLYARNRAFS
jgi:hypothetical protein